MLRFFFFQAEDGIRDESVTGVQTCALPIDRKSTRLNSSTLSSRCRLLLEFRRVLFRSDRKSTRLNSSHTLISYAVFCLSLRPRRSTSVPSTSLFRSDRKSTRFFFLMIRRPPRFPLFPNPALFR